MGRIDWFWPIMIVYLVLTLMLAAGCASKTVVTYTGPDGRSITYESSRDQAGLDVELHQDAQGNIKGLTIKVDKTSQSDAAMANQGKLIELLGMAIKSGGKF